MISQWFLGHFRISREDLRDQPGHTVFLQQIIRRCYDRMTGLEATRSEQPSHGSWSAVCVKTYEFINVSGVNTHKSQLFWCSPGLQGFDPKPCISPARQVWKAMKHDVKWSLNREDDEDDGELMVNEFRDTCIFRQSHIWSWRCVDVVNDDDDNHDDVMMMLMLMLTLTLMLLMLLMLLLMLLLMMMVVMMMMTMMMMMIRIITYCIATVVAMMITLPWRQWQ